MSTFAELPIKKVIPDAEQPRQYFDATKLATLAASIKQVGIKKPVLVERQLDDTYKLIDGERRYRAAVQLGLKTIPALVEEPMQPIDRLIEQFHVQEQYESWSPYEKALAIRDIAKSLNLPMEKLAPILSISSFLLRDYQAFVSLLSHKEFTKNEVPLSFARPLQSLTKYAVMQMLEQAGADVSREDQKKFQVNVIKRIVAGEIIRPSHLLKIRDSITQDAVKAIEAILTDDSSIEKLFRETNAEQASAYRSFGNFMTGVERSFVNFKQIPSLRDIALEDKELQSRIKRVIKNLSTLVND